MPTESHQHPYPYRDAEPISAAGTRADRGEVDESHAAAGMDESAPTTDLIRVYLAEIGRTRLLTAAEEVDLATRIEAGVYAAELLRRADAERPQGDLALHDLDRGDAHRAALVAIAADGRAAMAHMVRANLRLVVAVAKKYSRRGVPFLDLVQEGNLGLIRAVEKFDYRKGYKFSTYATWWIRQAIGRGLSEQGRTIRLPAHVAEEVAKLFRVERQLLDELGRMPTPAEIAELSGQTTARVVELRRIGRDSISLDSPLGDDGETVLGDLVEDVGSGAAAEAIEYQAMVDDLRRVIEQLPEREAYVLRMRYGLADGKPRTRDEVGRHLGVTRERIRQLENSALTKLRDPRTSRRLLDWAS